MKIRITPSLLSADFGRLGDQIREATEAGADLIHVEIVPEPDLVWSWAPALTSW